jgi:hypothetical protein
MTSLLDSLKVARQISIFKCLNIDWNERVRVICIRSLIVRRVHTKLTAYYGRKHRESRFGERRFTSDPYEVLWFVGACDNKSDSIRDPFDLACCRLVHISLYPILSDLEDLFSDRVAQVKAQNASDAPSRNYLQGVN